ncbi:Flp pilus assembly protein CpaB [Nocardioides sp. BP30]|uniref:Flp pilus assembly protein CpaB n=1 Tax=Nocardioides sp. BP30 TaxID=3036374 RepID=UPI0024689FA8|nr:Flp pilus assembly protein CpaB [Nocardioides sp. BP30]WGL53812.1 Flp pilus assembly protein CpaB [Nocardioides sp. BP30]
MAAAVVAALGVVLVLLYVRGADHRAQDRFATVEVLTATGQINPGETVEQASAAGRLALRAVTRNELLDGYQTNTAGLAGQVALTTIYPGEQIIASKFGTSAAPISALTIPDGMVAISVNLTDPARVAGFVVPGSQVAVFVNGTTAGQPYTRLLLPKVQVLGVGSTTPVSTTTAGSQGQTTGEQLPSTLLTLAVDQQEAQKVLFAQGNGQLAFALLTDSSRVAPGPATTLGSLYKQG